MLPITPPPKGRARLVDRSAARLRAISRTSRAARSRTRVRSRPSRCIESNSGSPRRTPFDRGVEQPASTLRELDAERLDRPARRSSALDRPVARLDVRDHRVEDLADALGARDAPPTTRARSRTRRRRRRGTSIWSTICDQRDRALLADRHRVARRPRGRRRRRSARAPSAARAPTRSSRSSRRIHSPLSQSSFSRSKTAAACVTRSRSNSRDQLARRP